MNTTIVYGLKQLESNGTWITSPERHEGLRDAINAEIALRATRNDLAAKVQSYDRSIVNGQIVDTERKD